MKLFERIRAGRPRVASPATGNATDRPATEPRLHPRHAAAGDTAAAGGAGGPATLGLTDGVLGYHLFLGRAPEDEEVAGQMVGRSVEDMAETFLASAEFVERILRPVAAGGEPGEWQGGMTRAELAAPLADMLALDRDAMAAAQGWAEVLGGLFGAPVARAVLQRLHGEAAEALLARADEAFGRARQRKEAGKAALAALQARARGLSIGEVHDLVLLPDGSLEATSDDPWIIADLPFAEEGSALYRLAATLRTGGGAPFTVKLYLDLGDDFHEGAALSTLHDGRGDTCFMLAGLHRPVRVRMDPVDARGRFELDRFEFERIDDPDTVERMVRETVPDGAEAFYRSRAVRRLLEDGSGARIGSAEAIALSRELTALVTAEAMNGDYHAWIERYERPSAADYERMAQMMAGFARRPSFSFLVPTYNTPVELLDACVNSLLDQNYPDFTICIADDRSSDARTTAYLDALAARDHRVRLARRTVNGHISEASNSALALVDGDYVVLVDHDDVVPDYCLFVLAEAINRHPQAKVLFSDEDKLDEDGNRRQPYFKTSLNMFLLYGHNMISHLGVYSTELVRQVGGFRKGFEGSQDYDLALRCIESVRPDEVVHIPHVLYHWRMIAGSTAIAVDEKSYAAGAGVRAVQEHFVRTDLPLQACAGVAPGINGAQVINQDGLVSIIIPTRDGLELLKSCLNSIESMSTGNYEIIIIDNDSSDPETLAYLAELGSLRHVKVVSWPKRFNFSEINNFGVEHSNGEVLCFLNNDTEVISSTWLDRARALLSIAKVGAVGARLLYPDGSLQHMGVVVGMGAHGVAGTPHGGMEGASPGYLGKARLLAEFSAVTAACLFVRRTDFIAVGRFDTALAVAYNDIDLCLKLRAHGLKVICDPDVTLIHKESRTRGYDRDSVRAKRLQEEADLFKSRWSKELSNDPFYSPNHSLLTSSFDLAWPPRVSMPWLVVPSAR